MIDGLAFTAASVPGGPLSCRRQMGSIIECSVDKLRPPHQQISSGWGDMRGGGSAPSVHLALRLPGREHGLSSRPHLICTDSQDLRAAGGLSIYLVFQV